MARGGVEDFAFWVLKKSDLMHTLGEFFGILSIKNLKETKYTFIEYASSSSRRCLAR